MTFFFLMIPDHERRCESSWICNSKSLSLDFARWVFTRWNSKHGVVDFSGLFLVCSSRVFPIPRTRPSFSVHRDTEFQLKKKVRRTSDRKVLKHLDSTSKFSRWKKFRFKGLRAACKFRRKVRSDVKCVEKHRATSTTRESKGGLVIFS